jgi:hypothetical protein
MSSYRFAVSGLQQRGREEVRSTLFAMGLAGAAVLLLGAGALLLPLVDCPVCPPGIFTITTNGIAPGAPITDPWPMDCVCRKRGGRVSALLRWRHFRALAAEARGG